jgi:GTP-binding protein
MNNGIWDFIRAEFVTSAVRAEQYPKPSLPEVAFLGRSNVGKSSLINSLCRRKNLARVSATPGKTQTLNYYKVEAKRTVDEQEERTGFYVVDLPGYGYARTSKDNKELWSAFIRNYLVEAPDLQLVCQLLDIRRELMPNDLEGYKWLLQCGHRVQLVLTKADKLSHSAAEAKKNALKKQLGIDDSRIILYSVTQPLMRAELINRIMAILAAGGVEIGADDQKK